MSSGAPSLGLVLATKPRLGVFFSQAVISKQRVYVGMGPVLLPLEQGGMTVSSSSLGSVSVAHYFLSANGGGRGAYFERFRRGRGEKEEENSRGGREQITTFYSKEKGCN